MKLIIFFISLFVATVTSYTICSTFGLPELTIPMVAGGAFVSWFYAGQGIASIITAGLSVPCESRSGGVATIFLTDRDNVASFTLTVDLYTAVVMVGPAVFFKFEFEEDTAELRENGSLENGSTQMIHEIEFFVPKMTQTSRNRIQELFDSSACGMIAIVEDNNNNFWVVGYSENFLLKKPLKMLTDASGSGKVFTDLNGHTVTVQSTDNEKMRTFTGAVPV